MTGYDEREALRRLGWSGSLEREMALAAPASAEPGRVVARHRDRWEVAVGRSGEITRISALLPGTDGRPSVPEPPAVGDWVVLEVPGGRGETAGTGETGEPGGTGGRAEWSEGPARIVGLLPRSGAFTRRAVGTQGQPQVVAANVDVALVVAALTELVNERRLERYAALAWEAGAAPLVVLTKLDRAEEAGVDAAEAVAAAERAVPGSGPVAVSPATGAGMAELAGRMEPGRTAVLLGPSGVGKSTLLNWLLGEDRQRTREIRRDGKGRHTTTHRELFIAPGGALLIDTPGLREVGLWGSGAGLAEAFADIAALAVGCRFRDCAHDGEPECAVAGAVERGELTADRLESWHALRRELAWQERREDPLAAAEEARRWRMIHRSVRVHLKRRYEEE